MEQKAVSLAFDRECCRFHVHDVDSMYNVNFSEICVAHGCFTF